MFLENDKQEKKGLNKTFIAALAIAAMLVAVGVWLLTFQTTKEEQRQQELAGAFLEGSPEFSDYTKELIIQTNFDKTFESRTGLGTMMMTIHGRIRNKGEKTLNGLEISVGVVDRENKVLREKNLMVIPNQRARLAPNEMMDVSATFDGFDPKDDRANVRWKVTAIRFE